MSSEAPTGASDIQLYSLATPNGQKIGKPPSLHKLYVQTRSGRDHHSCNSGVALEEMGLPYDAHTIDIRKNVQFEPWYPTNQTTTPRV
jgi:hypothetical protein